ncbi:MAG TPA: BamA/TamA family outer membrane protein, partial [Terriglobia bacterium]|nr:BamA/TamA family outer membrane protein [Terriglobia bacterium]
PPTIAVGVSAFGADVGGGTALYWSDLLGQHNLMTSVGFAGVGFGNPLHGLSATAAYQNQKSRWSWGVVGGQVSMVSESYATGLDVAGGVPIIVDDTIRILDIQREAAGVFSYPFNRTSRLEFSSGYRNFATVAEREQTIYLAETGELIGQGSLDLPSVPSIHLATGSAAFVFDTSTSAGLSPIHGERSRFEVSANAGSLQFTTALVDYRRYFRLPEKLSLAGRFLHFGRYGKESDDVRLQDVSIGYASLVRGYSIGSFTANECGASLQINGACPALDQLFGSRIAVANAELRLPLLGPFAAITTRSVPPVEAAAFYDAGAAWRKTETIPVFGDGSRHLVRSYGGTFRMNLLGFAIGQVSYVRPLDRGKGWHFEFALTSGF